MKLFAPALKQKGIQLRINVQQHPPLYADGQLLKQVFVNLVKNAMEATEASGRIDVIGTCEESNYEIQISDTGRGIPETDINSIFDWHFSTKEKGSGIGLSVVQQIIAAHRGYIDVTSEQGKGTTVIIRLPMAV
jgi:signal transduction histidine kinase